MLLVVISQPVKQGLGQADPLIPWTLNLWYKKYRLSWAMVQNRTGEGDEESPHLTRSEYEVWKGGHKTCLSYTFL